MTTLYISIVLIFFPVLSLKSHFNVTILILLPFEFESIPIEFASILFYSIYSILFILFSAILFFSHLVYSIRFVQLFNVYSHGPEVTASHQCPVSGCPVHGVGRLHPSNRRKSVSLVSQNESLIPVLIAYNFISQCHFI